MRFIHTADWQIGKSFKRFGQKEDTLRRARLSAIESIGRLAREQGAAHVLVAGDIYDTESPSPQSLREPLERMRTFPDIEWNLLPGNHDPHRSKGVWDRFQALHPPAHIRLLLETKAYDLGPDAALLAAPLTRKSEKRDLTAWMDEAETPAGKIRIGLAHGSTRDFGVDGQAPNPIDPRRADSARLDYLALGDWHQTLSIDPRVWYAGTPEPDRAGGQQQGTALVVEIEGPGAVPRVERRAVGAFRWISQEERVGDEPFDRLESRLRMLPELSSTVLRLTLAGALPLAERVELQRRLEAFQAAVFHLDVDDSQVHLRPSAEDLLDAGFDGVLRAAADRLQAMAADQGLEDERRRRAEDALIELFLAAQTTDSRGAAV